MALGLERSDMAHFYFPQNTDILILSSLKWSKKMKTFCKMNIPDLILMAKAINFKEI